MVNHNGYARESVAMITGLVSHAACVLGTKRFADPGDAAREELTFDLTLLQRWGVFWSASLLHQQPQYD
jgi:hypothetical protein